MALRSVSSEAPSSSSRSVHIALAEQSWRPVEIFKAEEGVDALLLRLEVSVEDAMAELDKALAVDVP